MAVQELIELALRVNELLHQYIQIHDSIFKFSIRQAIPMPGIFKAIDYGSHYESLYFIKQELEEIIISMPNASNANLEFAQALGTYAQALLQSITILRETCGKLYEKSQGNLTSYTKQSYNSDFEIY
jgi:hypothetical protein